MSSVYCHHCGAANPAENAVCFACEHVLGMTEEQELEQEQAPLLRERYRLRAQVGTGGFGAVYRAEDTTQDDAIVAIKQINLAGLSAQEKIEATDGFYREVRLLSGLKHPNLPTIHDSFTDPEHWYIVMDFIDGETLETYLAKRFSGQQEPGLPLSETLDLGLQLCTVLDYLHTRQPPIIFRDLKPANIMRTPAGQVYLIDFGIARHFIPGKPKDTIPFGSPGYAPPEQYGKAQTTPQADIYSLGALLHQALSGDDPAESPFRFAPLRLYGTIVIADLNELIQRMVQVDASQRPASAAEVKELLQRLADEQAKSEPRVWRPPETSLPLPPHYTTYTGWHSGAAQQQVAQPVQPQHILNRRRFVRTVLGIGGTLVVGYA
ncbi:MAG TPA: serine/threonine-protein kinase, partial [Ktedonobacteraceae bacterium]|nr:serine/threonine-protein kinase [Ktedonobacteraceae bacterium]